MVYFDSSFECTRQGDTPLFLPWTASRGRSTRSPHRSTARRRAHEGHARRTTVATHRSSYGKASLARPPTKPNTKALRPTTTSKGTDRGQSSRPCTARPRCHAKGHVSAASDVVRPSRRCSKVALALRRLSARICIERSRGVPGCGNPEFKHGAENIGADPRLFGRGACGVCPGSPELKAAGTGTRFSNSPIRGQGEAACGGAPQAYASRRANDVDRRG